MLIGPVDDLIIEFPGNHFGAGSTLVGLAILRRSEWSSSRASGWTCVAVSSDRAQALLEAFAVAGGGHSLSLRRATSANRLQTKRAQQVVIGRHQQVLSTSKSPARRH